MSKSIQNLHEEASTSEHSFGRGSVLRTVECGPGHRRRTCWQEKSEITFGKVLEGDPAFRTLTVLFALLLPLANGRASFRYHFQEMVVVEGTQDLNRSSRIGGVNGWWFVQWDVGIVLQVDILLE
jgi:hypothetical protein